jgi:hypothetical protein
MANLGCGGRINGTEQEHAIPRQLGSAAGEQEMTLSKTTKDHDEIRKWAESRGAVPAEVRGTERNGDTGILRFEFKHAPHHNDSKLQEIPWDEFFEKFDENDLEMVYQEKTADGAKSNFNKLVHPDSEEHSSRSKSHSSSGSSHSGKSGKSDSDSNESRSGSRSSGSKSHTSSSSTSHSAAGSKAQKSNVQAIDEEDDVDDIDEDDIDDIDSDEPQHSSSSSSSQSGEKQKANRSSSSTKKK